MRKADSSTMPLFIIQWHITGLCDQSCLHCYMVNDSESHKRELSRELSLADCKAVIDSFLEFCRIAKAWPSINFTGGDPLLAVTFSKCCSMLHLVG